jgi:hypothetical protein
MPTIGSQNGLTQLIMIDVKSQVKAGFTALTSRLEVM